MSVYLETTNLPNIIKFITPAVITHDNFEFTDLLEAGHSPIAATLLQFPFIEKVYISGNYIAVQKNDAVQWEAVVEELKALINEAVSEGKLLNGVGKKETPISIYIESTPNPNVVKMVANIMLTNGIIEIKSHQEASKSPLAAQLLIAPYITEIFITENYISIMKNETVEWGTVSADLRDEITRLLQDGVKIMSDEVAAQQSQNTAVQKNNFNEDEQAIQAILDEYVKPGVTSDGGNIELIEYDADKKTVFVLLQGACSGCPSSTLTLKSGIENLLKQMLPEKIEAVEAING